MAFGTSSGFPSQKILRSSRHYYFIVNTGSSSAALLPMFCWNSTALRAVAVFERAVEM
jgi:hypothetical protein